MNKWINNIQNTLMPSVCVLCGDAGNHQKAAGSNLLDLCDQCQNELPRLASACARCAEPLTSTPGYEALCGRCQSQPPAFNRCLAMLSYQAPADHLLQALKFNGRLEMARLLGVLMADWLEDILDAHPSVIIPVPLHENRLRERGFNQAMELARPVAQQLGITIDNRLCRRIHTTAPQSDLTRKERIKNIKGAFQINKPVSGHVAIIDDVMTTGSTAHELSKVLLRAGATDVDVWVCARA